MKPLTLIQGGRNQPEIIQVERRAWDELAAELAVSRAERLTFAVAVRKHALWSLHGLATGTGDPERHMVALLRLAAQEQARAAAAGIDGDVPVAIARRAA